MLLKKKLNIFLLKKQLYKNNHCILLKNTNNFLYLKKNFIFLNFFFFKKKNLKKIFKLTTISGCFFILFYNINISFFLLNKLYLNNFNIYYYLNLKHFILFSNKKILQIKKNKKELYIYIYIFFFFFFKIFLFQNKQLFFLLQKNV